MKLPPTTGHVRLFLLLAGLILQAPLAAAQAPPPAASARLTVDARHRLTEAARDPKLAFWQREFMQGLGRDGVEGAASRSSAARTGAPLRSSSTMVDDGTWIAAAQPTARFCHTAIYDPVRDRMIVFGGYDGGFRNDVWALSLSGTPVWCDLSPSGTAPTPRNVQTAIYDPVRDRMIVFGGFDVTGNYVNDTWALTLSGSPAWSDLTPSGTPPSGRGWHTTIYDPVRDRMLMFGGRDGTTFNNDVWSLTLGESPEWTALAPSGTLPAGRFSHAAIYDPVRDRMLVFGGDDGSVYRNDLWAMSLTESPEWTELTPVGAPPTARPGHVAIYDPATDRMVVFGGYDGNFLNDAWALTLAGGPEWSELTASGAVPLVRGWHTAIYDPVRGRMVAFGGEHNPYSFALKDVWSLSLTAGPSWSALALGGGTRPAGRYSHVAVADPTRDRMLVFGGDDGNNRNDVWELSLPGVPSWTLMAPDGDPPPPRHDHTALYDPVRDRIVVFGGRDGANHFNDVWTLSLTGTPTWSALAPSGTPPAGRYSHTAIYDPIRDRMVVFGGSDSLSNFNDVWALSLSENPEWSEIIPTGSLPTTRLGHTAIYDPNGDAMVTFAGSDSSYRNDLWTLSLGPDPAWSELTPSGTPPDARGWHTAIWDPARGRMVVFGGWDGSCRSDAWALTLTGGAAWNAIVPAGTSPSARFSHTAVYDPARDEMVVFGGDDGGGYRDDLWLLKWTSPVSVPSGAAALSRRFELSLPRPNPSRGQSFVDFELQEPARVALDVFDTQGRRVKQIADGWFTAGRHALAWHGDDERGHALGTGVYFIRMQGSGFQVTRRTMLIR